MDLFGHENKNNTYSNLLEIPYGSYSGLDFDLISSGESYYQANFFDEKNPYPGFRQDMEQYNILKKVDLDIANYQLNEIKKNVEEAKNRVEKNIEIQGKLKIDFAQSEKRYSEVLKNIYNISK